jgi:hypothetical protein
VYTKKNFWDMACNDTHVKLWVFWYNKHITFALFWQIMSYYEQLLIILTILIFMLTIKSLQTERLPKLWHLLEIMSIFKIINNSLNDDCHNSAIVCHWLHRSMVYRGLVSKVQVCISFYTFFATPAVTQDLGCFPPLFFGGGEVCGLIWRTVPFCRLLRQAHGTEDIQSCDLLTGLKCAYVLNNRKIQLINAYV